ISQQEDIFSAVKQVWTTTTTEEEKIGTLAASSEAIKMLEGERTALKAQSRGCLQEQALSVE
ncbi:hypothetical protein DFQ27_002872, partial [Actinomortierella ambigua]